jgi:hypothetical protein
MHVYVVYMLAMVLISYMLTFSFAAYIDTPTYFAHNYIRDFFYNFRQVNYKREKVGSGTLAPNLLDHRHHKIAFTVNNFSENEISTDTEYGLNIILVHSRTSVLDIPQNMNANICLTLLSSIIGIHCKQFGFSTSHIPAG